MLPFFPGRRSLSPGLLEKILPGGRYPKCGDYKKWIN